MKAPRDEHDPRGGVGWLVILVVAALLTTLWFLGHHWGRW